MFYLELLFVVLDAIIGGGALVAAIMYGVLRRVR